MCDLPATSPPKQPGVRESHTSRVRFIDILYGLIDRDHLCCVLFAVLVFRLQDWASVFRHFCGWLRLALRGCIPTLVILPNVLNDVPALVFMGRRMTIQFRGGFSRGGGQKFYCHLAALLSMCRRTTIIFFISFCAGPCLHGTQDDNKILGGGQ